MVLRCQWLARSNQNKSVQPQLEPIARIQFHGAAPTPTNLEEYQKKGVTDLHFVTC